MNKSKFLFCQWVDLHEVTEEESVKKGFTIALYDTVLTNVGWKKVALMIFIKKFGIAEYEVLVFKSDKSNKYIKHPEDNFIRLDENDDYISFFFYNFFTAHIFADSILPLHDEFRDRPIVKLS